MTTVACVEPIDLEVDEFDFVFSTTDREGVIEEENRVFVSLARHEHEQPHGITRHPDMPAGAFEMVRDQLEAGRPACAYVKDIATDGGTDWVFATLLPVGGTYLSVRMKPLVTSLKEAWEELYEKVRPAELEARENEGAAHDETATIGLALIAEGPASLGVSSADDLALTCLPLEVQEHERLFGSLPHRPGADGPLADLLEVMHAIEVHTSPLVAQLHEYDALAAALEESSHDAGPACDRLTQLVDAATVGAAIDGVPQLIPDLTEKMTRFANDAADMMAALDGTLRSLAREVRRLRMLIALLRLHNRIVGTYCIELIDGASTANARTCLPLLAQALSQGAAELADAMDTVRAALSKAPSDVEQAVRCADRTLRFATKWRGEAEAAEDETRAALTPTVETLLAKSATGFDELRHFYEVAARCATLPDAYDHDDLTAQVVRMRDVVETIAHD